MTIIYLIEISRAQNKQKYWKIINVPTEAPKGTVPKRQTSCACNEVNIREQGNSLETDKISYCYLLEAITYSEVMHSPLCSKSHRQDKDDVDG